MKALVGVTDNDWLAFLSPQPKMDEMIFLRQQSAIITAGGALYIHRDHRLTKTGA